MSSSEFQVRRATVDDLQSLTALWDSMRFPCMELEKRLTEFQIAESTDGELLGAVGVEINARHGKIHSEAFNDFALSDQLRSRLWERIQSLAQNHGLVRLWTTESAPFWKQMGFEPAAGEVMERLPVNWNSPDAAWLTLRLRDEQAIEVNLEKEFKRFMESEKMNTEGLLRHTRTLKYVAAAVAIVLAGVIVLVSVFILKNRQNFMR